MSHRDRGPSGQTSSGQQPSSLTVSDHQHFEADWEAQEELRQRELEEARARAAQMEKTMRWWSDCTANWREKWSKVRTERNKSREEARLLRTKLEVASKENLNLKREKADLEMELNRVRKDAESLKIHAKPTAESTEDTLTPLNLHVTPERDMSCTNKSDADKPMRLPRTRSDSGDPVACRLTDEPPSAEASGKISGSDLEFLDRLLQQSQAAVKDLANESDRDRKDARKKTSQLWDEIPSPEWEVIEQKASMLKLHLHEATKTIQVEREEKTNLHKTLERIQHEHSELKLKYDELKTVKQETLKELNQLKSEHQDELDSMRLDLEDEANSRSSMDRRLSDLRTQLERLQAENAAEWGKRERLETEKLALERENKKLRTQIEDLEERLERKTKQCTGSGEADAKTLQHEIHDKNKELADLKHSHNKLKKVLQDKTTDLAHAMRRAEQYETEVKKLRCRVEELKKELAIAEDEVDSATNSLRKLQRTNDELQERADSLQVQADHLQSRLRNSNHSLIGLRGTDSLLNNEGLSEDDNVEF